MTTTSYTVNTNAITKQRTQKNKTKKSLGQFIKQLNPLNWFNIFSDIEINMEDFSTKKSTQKTN